MGSRPNIIVEGQKPDGNYVPLKTNSNGELIVAGSIGGGSSALQITDGVDNATITDVAGKKALERSGLSRWSGVARADLRNSR